MREIWTIRSVLARHRRLAGLLGVLVVLGVAALNVHAALPDHHDEHGVATVCVAALSIAVLVAASWSTRRSFAAKLPRRFITIARPPARLGHDRPAPSARAGPDRLTVLRI